MCPRKFGCGRSGRWIGCWRLGRRRSVLLSRCPTGNFGLRQPLGRVRMAKSLIAALLAILLNVNASLGQGKRLSWQPADYYGVKVGKSTSSDLTRLFGKPQQIFNPEDEYDNPIPALISYSYDNLVGFRTVFTMKKQSRIVFEIGLHPSYKRRLDNNWMLSELRNEYIKRIHDPCP